MADYFAVLQRTLAGFDSPQDRLRQKLYERARVTIRRQLDARSPAANEATIESEMAKLEQAIVDIEVQYGGEPVAQPEQAAVAEPEPVHEPVVEAPSPEPEPSIPTAEPAPELEPEIEPEAALENAPPIPIFEQPAEVVAEADTVDTVAAEANIQPAEVPVAEPVFEAEAQQVDDQVGVAQTEPEVMLEELPEPVVGVEEAPDGATAEDPIADALMEFTKADALRKAEQAVEDAVGTVEDALPVVEQPEQNVDMTANEAVEAALSALPAAANLPEELPGFDVPEEPALASDIEAPSAPDYSDPAAQAIPETPGVAPIESPVTEPAVSLGSAGGGYAVPELQPVNFNEDQSEDLAIPPAPGLAGGEPRKRRKGRLLLWLVLLLLLCGAAYAAFMTFGEPIMQTLGLAQQSSTTTPTKVKTIKVSPQPIEEEPTQEQPAAEVTPEPEPEPKSEARLNENGEEVTPQPVEQPSQEGLAAASDTAAEPAAPAASNEGQRAFLYEEDAANGTSNVNNGSVSWSIVQESPGPGQPEEPAIRAQIEIPERKTVLIMTLKRNTDPGLTASHLIDMIFAVPDDFSGGAIEEINRVVMKETEEGNGETLTAGSVKIQSGIFLIALDNLESARERNIELLKTRSWIDIPVQYRTGRRALVTVEKGAAGEAAFKEAFAAWDKSS